MSKSRPHTLAKAFHNYKPQSENEIELTKGDILKVFEKFENGWWVGETSSGKLGVFPGSYVKEFQSKPTDNIETTNTQPNQEQNKTAQTKQEQKPISEQVQKPISEPKQEPKQQQPQETTNKTGTETKRKTGKRKVIGQAEVLYDYDGKTDTELQLKKGSTVNILCKLQEDGWWQGEFEGRFGHFPAKYVREITQQSSTTDESENKAVPDQLASSNEGKPTIQKLSGTSSQSGSILTDVIAIALYDYNGMSEDELSFKKGDEIGILPAGSDTQWRKGILQGKQANFPCKYVVEVPFSSLSNKNSKMAIALYTFQAVDESELNLKKGDVVQVLQSGAPDAWWKGQVGKSQGHFPGNYIKVLPTKDEISSRFGISDDLQSIEKEQEQPALILPEEQTNKEENQPEVKETSNNTNNTETRSMETSNESNSENNSATASTETTKTKTKKKLKPKVRKESVSDALELMKDLSIVDENEPKPIEQDEEKPTEQNEKSMDSEGSKETWPMSMSETVTESKEISEKSEKSEQQRNRTFKKRKPIGSCVAKYNHVGNRPDILSFNIGDEIAIYSKTKSGWWKGELHDQIGYFPGSYVTEKNLRDKERKIAVKALCDYNAESETELSFKKGDIFLQLDSPNVGHGWARGERKGSCGHFPPDFVEVISTVSPQQSSEIAELRVMVHNLQKQLEQKNPSSFKSSKRDSGDTDLRKRLEESEKIRADQQKQIKELTGKVDVLSSQVTKQNENISKQQKTVKKLSKQSSSTQNTPNATNSTSVSPRTSSASIEELREYLSIEARQRRDLESIVRKLEAHHEVLSRQVAKLQRTFDEQTTEQQIGKNRLRPTGRDLTQ